MSELVAFHHIVTRPAIVEEDELPRSLLRLDGRIGARTFYDRDDDTALVLGIGAALLRVTGGDPRSCLYPGIGDQTRDAFGIELWLDGHVGGDPALGAGMVTIGAVYQTDWYLRKSDCGS